MKLKSLVWFGENLLTHSEKVTFTLDTFSKQGISTTKTILYEKEQTMTEAQRSLLVALSKMEGYETSFCETGTTCQTIGIPTSPDSPAPLSKPYECEPHRLIICENGKGLIGIHFKPESVSFHFTAKSENSEIKLDIRPEAQIAEFKHDDLTPEKAHEVIIKALKGAE